MTSSIARLLPIALVAASPIVASRSGALAQDPAAIATQVALEISEVAPGVFFAETPTRPEFLGSNLGFVLLHDEVVVVDASFPIAARALLAEIGERTNLPVRFAFDTHYHDDHAFGNSVFADGGAAIVAQRRCVEESGEKSAARFQAQPGSENPGRRKTIEGASWRPATVIFDERMELGDATRRVELLHFGRAHTSGDAVAWLPNERVLFSGDVCVNGPFNYLGDGDTGHWIEVLDRLIALQPKVVCPGHGKAGGPELLAQQRRWIVELRAAVAAGLAAGLDVDAIREALDLPWYEQWTGVAAKSRKGDVQCVFDELAGLRTPKLLLEDLKLAPGPSPTRETAGWSAPKKVVVAGMGDAEIQRLRRVAPGVELVPLARGADPASVVADADAVLGACGAALLDAGPKLRWCQVGSAGVERYVGLPRIASRAVVLTNAQRLMGPQIADHAVAMLLSLTRALPAAIANQRGERKWELPAAARDGMVELRGKTVLVAGLGGIGREVAQRVHAFGARVLATASRPSTPPSFVERVGPPSDLLAMAAEADVVFVCVPLTKETEKLVDAKFLATLKRGAFLVNIARGRCVDTAALVAALQSGQLAGAGLDVTDPEPLPPNHELWTLPNVIITPHDAGSSDDDERHFLLFRENLRRFVNGEPLLSVVDPELGF